MKSEQAVWQVPSQNYPLVCAVSSPNSWRKKLQNFPSPMQVFSLVPGKLVGHGIQDTGCSNRMVVSLSSNYVPACSWVTWLLLCSPRKQGSQSHLPTLSLNGSSISVLTDGTAAATTTTVNIIHVAFIFNTGQCTYHYEASALFWFVSPDPLTGGWGLETLLLNFLEAVNHTFKENLVVACHSRCEHITTPTV